MWLKWFRFEFRMELATEKPWVLITRQLDYLDELAAKGMSRDA